MTEEERRTSRRISVFLPGESGLLHSTGKDESEQVLIDNVASSGLKLRTSGQTNLKEADQVYLRVNTTEPEGFVNLQGEVRWVTPRQGSENEWEIGVRLTGMDFEDWDAWYEMLGWHDDA